MLEPERRHSGPAIAAAAVLALRRDPRAVVMTLAADHVILDLELFHAGCRAGREAALTGHIVTFGLRRPSRGQATAVRRGAAARLDGAHAVAAFVEKPDAATAARYVAEGYSGTREFRFSCRDLLSELERYEPSMAVAVEAAVSQGSTDLGFLRLAPAAFASTPKISIDYAVIERPTARRWSRGAFAGRISAAGMWSTRSAITMPTAMSCTVRRSRRIQGTALSMRRAGSPSCLGWMTSSS